MFDSTLEFITQAASSSLCIFIFCNLIIVIILTASKPSSELLRETQIPLNIVINTSTRASYHQFLHVNKRGSTLFSGEQETQQCDEKGNGDHEDVAGDAEDEDEDELRRRVEEFIHKINQGWRAESSRTSRLV